MTSGCVTMLNEVSAGDGSSATDGTVEYSVADKLIEGREGVTGVTDRFRMWYHANTKVCPFRSAVSQGEWMQYL